MKQIQETRDMEVRNPLQWFVVNFHTDVSNASIYDKVQTTHSESDSESSDENNASLHVESPSRLTINFCLFFLMSLILISSYERSQLFHTIISTNNIVKKNTTQIFPYLNDSFMMQGLVSFKSTSSPKPFPTSFKLNRCPVKIFVHSAETLGINGSVWVIKSSLNNEQGHSGYREADQFSLPESLHWKALHSPCRVTDQALADFFWIPVKNARYLHGAVRFLNDTNIFFKRLQGKNHIITIERTWSANSRSFCNYFFSKPSSCRFPRSNMFWDPTFKQMIKLTIEKFGHMIKWNMRHDPAMIPRNIIGVPYPSSIIPKEEDIYAKRTHLVSFVGSEKKHDLRKLIIAECKNRTDVCILAENERIYRNSTFFFSPPGDSGTRKALFDGLLSGSIPVIFSTAALDIQYQHFFPNPRSISVLILQNDNILDELMAIPTEVILEYRRNIEKIKQYLAYSTNVEEEDAFVKILQILELVKKRKHDDFQGLEHLQCTTALIREHNKKCFFESPP